MRCSIARLETVKGIQKMVKHEMGILERDKFVLRVKAGNGGKGLLRFDGIGGRGGDVRFVPKKDMSFTDIPSSIGMNLSVVARSGSSAIKTKLVGEDAPHTIVRVPFGVELVDEDKGILLHRLDAMHKGYTVARGGEGGRRENGFRAERGEDFRVAVHMKLRPNLALLGFPNAGKSTLVKALIPEKSVKIASYPFTTTKPQMAFWKGRGEGEGERSLFTLSIADLPGVIEGASRNRGRGFSFLKHLEYADIVLLVVDVNGFQLKNELNEPFRSALECVALLNKEVEAFDSRVLGKPVIVVLNKIDVCMDVQSATSLASLLSSPSWFSSLPSHITPNRSFRIVDVVMCSAKKGELGGLRGVLTERSRLIHPDNRLDS